MSHRKDKKGRKHSEAEEGAVTRTNNARNENTHIGYRDGMVRTDHLTPKARKALGRRMFD